MNGPSARSLTLIDLALEEDLGRVGDITARACLVPGRRGRARIEARQTGVVCGLELVRAVFMRLADGRPLEIRNLVEEGARVTPMQRLLDIEGDLAVILGGERTALNFLQRLSGIASMTRSLVDRLEGSSTRILDTRKTLPGWRELDKAAVACGGGRNHRHGLYDLFLIKENHIRGAGGIMPALERARALRDREDLDCQLEIEVENLAELEQAIAGGADIVMLDNFTPEGVSSAVELAGGRVLLEVSGGITADNLADYARRGVDFISIGALTHSVKAFDCSLLVEEVDS
ncbi:MAG: carboxylating nicotinate-nucleotide diphosphorylase [Calditrichaeota bacterium]|nr:carboxylating nicotinate-nucleotide diphosphorylase [Calditrichota bacterium]